MAKSTVSSIVDDLLQKEVLKETDSMTSYRGRRPVGLLFNPRARVSIGISIDDDRIDLAMCDLDGALLAVRRKKYARKTHSDLVIQFLLEELQGLLNKEKINPDNVAGLSLAVPGPVSQTKNPKINGRMLDLQKLSKHLGKKIKCAIFVDSNTNMLAVAECHRGSAQTSEEVFIVRLGREIRSALVKEKVLIRGNQGLSGNFGHIGLPNLKDQCGCGKLGCINSVAGFDALVARCRSLKVPVKEIDEVIDLAIDGDATCKKLLAEAGSAVGYGLAAAISIIAPCDVIVTGKLVSAGKVFITPLKTTLREYASITNFENCNLLFNETQKHSEAIGASLASLHKHDFLMRLVLDESEVDYQEALRA